MNMNCHGKLVDSWELKTLLTRLYKQKNTWITGDLQINQEWSPLEPFKLPWSCKTRWNSSVSESVCEYIRHLRKLYGNEGIHLGIHSVEGYAYYWEAATYLCFFFWRVAHRPFFPVTISLFLQVKILLFHYIWIFYFPDYVSHYYRGVSTMKDLGFLKKREILHLVLALIWLTWCLSILFLQTSKPLTTSMDIKESWLLCFTWKMGWRLIKRYRMKTIKCSWGEEIMIK